MIKQEHFILTGAAGKIISGDLTFDDALEIKGTILFIHGFKGFKDWGAHNLMASYFAQQGYRYIKFNLSHSGVTQQQPNDVTDLEAFAENTVSKELADVQTVINYISHTYTSNQLFVIGHSRGGGLAILTAANDPRISKVVTWSAIADFSSLWKPEQEEEWKKSGKIFVENARTKEKMPLNVSLLEDFKEHEDEYNLLDAAKKVAIPWLILHGDEDVNVQFNVAQQLAQAQVNAQLQKIEGANHVYGASHPYTEPSLPPQLKEVYEKTLAFLT